MKHCIYFIFISLVHTLAFAQAGRVMEVTYRYNGVSNLSQPERKTLVMWKLEIGPEGASFYDPVKRRADSMYAKDKAAITDPMEMMATISKYKQGVGFQAYTHFAKGKMTVLDNLGVYYSYEEKLPLQQWKLHGDSMRMLNKTVYKATADFRGRNYTAWYAPDIPAAAGPWKFFGLPGLILKVEDEKGHHSFECVGIEFPAGKTLAKTFIDDARPTNYAEFSRLRRMRAENPEAYLSVMVPGVNITPTDTQGKHAMQTAKQNGKNYNPLELTE